MQVSRLQLGVYANHANQQPFCIYFFPPVPSSSPRLESSFAIISRTTLFYRLRDIDVIFFGSSAGYVYNSGKIPQFYLNTSGYCFHERSGDIYLAACALAETAVLLEKPLLSSLCRLNKQQILSGTADQLLKSVSITRDHTNVEAEFEFVTAYPSPVSEYPSPPPANPRKRMSLEEVLDNDDSENNRRGISQIKQELPYSGSDHSNPSSPSHMPRSPDSPSSRKKRRISSNNIKVTHNPEVMEQVRTSLKLKQQQKAIIETRQQQRMLQQQRNFTDRRHSVAASRMMTSQNPWDNNTRINSTTASKRKSVSTHNRSSRNSRNLSVFAPPYSDQSIVSHRSPPQQTSPNSSDSLDNSPLITPVTPTMASKPVPRPSISNYSFSSNSAFRPVQKIQTVQTVHSASKSANINGLISPHNVEFTPSSASVSPNKNVSDGTTNSYPSNNESFINYFYDTVAHSQTLKSTLEDQIRKAGTLLQTLQASGNEIESLVRGHFQEMQREVVNDLLTLEKRIARVEASVRHSAAIVGMSPPLDPERRFSEISTASSDMGYGSYNNRSRLHPSNAASPPLSVVSSHSGTDDTHSKDYENVLSSLKTRLELLERRVSASD